MVSEEDHKELLGKYARLEQAVMGVIEMDRVCGDSDAGKARNLELLPNDSVMVADLLRGLGLPIGDYP